MNLQEQLTQLQQQIATEKQRGAEHDRFLVAQWEAQEAALLEQMMNEQVEQNHEVRMQESQSRTAHELDNLDFGGGMTLRHLIPNEDEYQQVSIKFKRLLEGRDDAWSRTIKGHEERELQVTAQNKYLQNVIATTENENAQLHNNVIRLTNDNIRLAEEKEYSDTERDAAIREAEGLRAEIQQLKSWNSDLRQQIELGVSGSMLVIDPAELERQKAEEKERVERIKAQRTIYDVVPDNDINPKNYTAKRVTDGEEISFNWTQKNSFIILEDEAQVLSFRIKHQAQALPDISLDEPVEITAPALEDVEQFREETGYELAVPTSGDQEAVSRQEFEALKADVEMLKHRNGMVA